MQILTGVELGLLAAGLGVPLSLGLLVVLPLAAAYWLLRRASRRGPALVAAASANHLTGLQNELAANYERLRRAGEAVPLAADVWREVRPRAMTMPPPVRRRLAQTYHAIEVSNRLLAAAAAYDRRGHLSLRQRRLSLWPTLEEAVRSGLTALGGHVARSLQVRVRPADARSATATVPREVQPFNLTAAPRLALFTGAGAPPAPSAAASRSPGQPPRRPRRRAVARQCEGQMPLWESVA